MHVPYMNSWQEKNTQNKIDEENKIWYITPMYRDFTFPPDSSPEVPDNTQPVIVLSASWVLDIKLPENFVLSQEPDPFILLAKKVVALCKSNSSFSGLDWDAVIAMIPSTTRETLNSLSHWRFEDFVKLLMLQPRLEYNRDSVRRMLAAYK